MENMKNGTHGGFTVYSHPSGTLFIKPSEIFKNKEGDDLIEALRQSSIYKSLKKPERQDIRKDAV
ncbi:MAG: hypothetical protein HGB11_03640 [Chlorobiales bacterium]|nr:hypothetical protein [Chlorobiales bacterium]